MYNGEDTLWTENVPIRASDKYTDQCAAGGTGGKFKDANQGRSRNDYWFTLKSCLSCTVVFLCVRSEAVLRQGSQGTQGRIQDFEKRSMG